MSNLDATVPLLGPDTVLVVHPLDLGEAGVVVALNGPGQASEVLEAANLGSHVLVITTELRHLASKLSKLFPIVLLSVTLIFHWLLVLSPTVKLMVPVSVSVGLRSM